MIINNLFHHVTPLVHPHGSHNLKKKNITYTQLILEHTKRSALSDENVVIISLMQDRAKHNSGHQRVNLTLVCSTKPNSSLSLNAMKLN